MSGVGGDRPTQDRVGWSGRTPDTETIRLRRSGLLPDRVGRKTGIPGRVTDGGPLTGAEGRDLDTKIVSDCGNFLSLSVLVRGPTVRVPLFSVEYNDQHRRRLCYRDHF